MTVDSPIERARRLAITILSEKRAPTEDDLELAVNIALAGVGAAGQDVNRDQLLRRLQEDVSVFIGDGSVLEDNDANHEPWLDRRRPEIEWAFWEGYREYLRLRVPPDVVRGLDTFTDDILSRLEYPHRTGVWDRRGMVVGQVQSGKTSNYTGLICKAADAGYKFIVVLAGLHNSLRSQTQQRLDEGFLGLDSRTSVAFENTNRAIGVGAGGRNHPPAFTLTSSDEFGDFSRQVASRVAGRIGSDPVILVVKKHKTILENLIQWVTTTNGQFDPATGRHVVGRFPLLVIDDEADNASVNTKEIEIELAEDGTVRAETNPSEINRLIRRLLHSFERSSLVSYTATPFANIFIHEDRPSVTHGEDLFPRSFILRIPPPTNYLGPAEVFGVPAVDDPEGLGRPGLPVVRTMEDTEDWLATGHRKTAVPGSVPTSLYEALRAFVLVCAARAARGQVNVHNSMLIHVTRFVDVQSLVYEQVTREIERIKDRLQYGDGEATNFRGELRKLWEADFAPTTARMPPEFKEDAIAWSAVEAALPAAVARVQVLQINGTAGDSLAYGDHPDGASIIAIGGDKLSRGLTLEGLSVSYYLRASKMYDTLMQMGRWFGYRKGYNDLVRLYTSGELQLWYRDITVANEELHAKFDEMARVRSNPREFALYVRKSPAGLLVTARAKMRSGMDMQLSYSGDVVETISFRKDAAAQNENLQHAAHFLEEQTRAGRSADVRSQNPTWDGVPGTDVAALLELVSTSDTATKANAALLARYVRNRVSADELTTWRIVLVNNSTAEDVKRVDFAGHQVGLTYRKVHGTENNEIYAIRRLASPSDEFIDLSEGEYRQALALTRAAWRAGATRAAREPTAPLGPYVRKVRPVTRGLLAFYLLDSEPARVPGLSPSLLGVLASFPESPGAPTINIVMPRRYWEREAA